MNKCRFRKNQQQTRTRRISRKKFSKIPTLSQLRRSNGEPFNKRTLALLKLLQERKLRVIPRIRFSMPTAFKEFAMDECKKRSPHSSEMPAFRFVLEKPVTRPYSSFTVYGEDEKKRCEMKIQVYGGQGPKKDMLKWLQNLLKFFSTKSDITAKEKFETVALCIAEVGSFQNDWANAVEEARNLEGSNNDCSLSWITP